MNHDTTDHILWPHEDETIELHCTCCDRPLTDVEASDPIIIDGKTFKDSCAGSLTQLRLQGFIKQAADFTKPLKEAHEWACYNAVARTYPFRKVNHI